MSALSARAPTATRCCRTARRTGRAAGDPWGGPVPSHLPPPPATVMPPSFPCLQLRCRPGAPGVTVQPQHRRRLLGAGPPGAGHHRPQHLPRRASAGSANGWGSQRAPRLPDAGTRGLSAAPEPLAGHLQPLQQADLQADPQVRGPRAPCPPRWRCPHLPHSLFSLPGSLLTPLSGRALIGASRAPPRLQEPKSVSAWCHRRPSRCHWCLSQCHQHSPRCLSRCRRCLYQCMSHCRRCSSQCLSRCCRCPPRCLSRCHQRLSQCLSQFHWHLSRSPSWCHWCPS